ncbi:MAG: putative integral rane protein [Bacteroidetes bacterium]|nr:putative integral rane protein [Bacteroidota bacterium]
MLFFSYISDKKLVLWPNLPSGVTWDYLLHHFLLQRWFATLGNWLGGMSCYYLGMLGKVEWIEKYLRIKKEKMDSFEVKLHKYGDWFAFFSFLPGIGDGIAVASGFFRCRWWIVALSMLLGKFVRYVVWMYANGFIMPR